MAPAKPSKPSAPAPYVIPDNPRWVVRSATERDAEYLSTRLTKATVAEMAAVVDCQPLTLLLSHLDLKGVIVEARKDKQPVAIFDLCPAKDTGVSALWFCFSDEVCKSEHLWTLDYYFADFIAHANQRHPMLMTYVDIRNVSQKLLVERLGFKAVETIPEYGIAKIPFILFKRESSKPN